MRMHDTETIADDALLAAASNQRWFAAWTALAALLLWGALAAPFFTGRVYVADDLGEFHLPLRNFYAQQLNRDEPVEWMPSLYGGFYVTAEGQLGAYHPWHWFLYSTFPLGAAFDLELLSTYPFLFVGTAWLLLRLVQRRDAALLGALAFTFGGFNLLHFVHPNAVAVVAHIPWLLAFIDVALGRESRSSRALAELGIALFTASQLLLGYPQYVWFSLLIETAFAAWLVWGETRTVALRRVAPLVWALVIGVTLGAAQLVPTLDALSHSLRSVADAELSNSGSLHPLNVIQPLAPYLLATRVVGQNTHELGFYFGAVPCVLCVWLLSQRGAWGQFRPLVVAAIVFGGCSLLLAFGEFGVLYRVQHWLPLVNRFRFPCRAIVLAQLCAAAGAAIAWTLLLSATPHEAHAVRRGRRAVLFAWIASVALAIVVPLTWPQYVADLFRIWTGPLLIGAAAYLLVQSQRGHRWAVVGLIVLTAVDLGTYGLSYAVYRAEDLNQFVAAVPLPPDLTNRRVVVPRETDAPRAGDRLLLAGLQRADGYAGLEPARALDFTDEHALKLAGVGWVWQPAVDPKTPGLWRQITPTAPRARFVTGTDAPFGAAPDALACVVSDKPGRIELITSSAAERRLVTTESFHGGWCATVDGTVLPVVRVDGDFLGCDVPSGSHRVTLEFQPASLWWGQRISYVGLGLLVCTLLARLTLPAAHRVEELQDVATC